jgi:hypothetical protein
MIVAYGRAANGEQAIEDTKFVAQFAAMRSDHLTLDDVQDALDDLGDVTENGGSTGSTGELYVYVETGDRGGVWDAVMQSVRRCEELRVYADTPEIADSVRELAGLAREIDRQECVLVPYGAGYELTGEKLDVLDEAASVESNAVRWELAPDDPAGDWTGRPPLGYEVVGGELVPDENLDEIAAVLQLVERGDLSEREGARRIGCGRATVRRCKQGERRALYGLD